VTGLGTASSKTVTDTIMGVLGNFCLFNVSTCMYGIVVIYGTIDAIDTYFEQSREYNLEIT
jgi:hypothetical protein